MASCSLFCDGYYIGYWGEILSKREGFEMSNEPVKNAMRVVSLRRLERGESMKAVLSLETASGIRLIDCIFHERNGSKWVSMPAKSYTKDDGGTAWIPLIDFSSRAVRDAFVKQAVTAVEKYLAEHWDKKPAAAKPVVNEESPF